MRVLSLSRLLIAFAVTVLIEVNHFAEADERAPRRTISLNIFDAATKKPIAARVYLTDSEGKPYFFEPVNRGSAFRYEKQNWVNKNSVEYHTTVSADPCYSLVPPGTYELIIERGKEYRRYAAQLDVDELDIVARVPLQRWSNAGERGWYSGDTHIHRNLDELKTIILAEDLNVVFPLTQWVTIADKLPSAGDKNIEGTIPNELVVVDSEHVIWPRNTEYEIFSVNNKRHTLGALFVLGHKDSMGKTVPPWGPVVDQAKRNDPNVIFDMDKLAWPFAMVLPTLAPDATYELANNHMWRTEFAFGQWYTPTPHFIQPPYGDTSGGHRDWIDFTLGMYYTLLNCGFRLPPSAGTANGVHPVPAGFGRVYVHLDDGFDYESWREGLRAGRSFVTTGPMLFAKAADQFPGHELIAKADKPFGIPIQAEVLSEHPLSFGEVLINGRPDHLLRAQNVKTPSGAYRTVINQVISPRTTGWFAIRFWENGPDGRVRFAHSAPWYVRVGEQDSQVSPDEKDYLVNRMLAEMQRSRGVVSEEAMAEYQRALEYYRALPVKDDTTWVKRRARPMANTKSLSRWLTNMIVFHKFTASEIRAVTGMSLDEAQAAIDGLRSQVADPVNDSPAKLRIMPYPGGRHPRRGFLDGAIDPQRETKVSIFPPWDDGGYAVVDVPEAIFTNLGLTYLAHTHIPTIWDDDDVELPKLEWKIASTDNHDDVTELVMERELPNGIKFGSHVQRLEDRVEMEVWLFNGTEKPLTQMRSQVCVMMKGLKGFHTQQPRVQRIRDPFVAVRADDKDRWLVTAWSPIKRVWTNPPVPCVHSDPIFPDCKPDQTVRSRGAVWFYEGEDIDKFIDELVDQWEG